MKTKKTLSVVCVFLLMGIKVSVPSVEMPGSCKTDQYYDTSTLLCQPCPVNASMNASPDGFACTCLDHSVPIDVNVCKPCKATEMVSADGRACVPRRCQTNGARTVCRKCPNDYVSVTQNVDGSPMKEVQCVKCARGYKARNNACVRCGHCACAKNEEAVAGACVEKRFIAERGKEKVGTAGDVIKLEYLCTQTDIRACRALAGDCVKSFYNNDLAGPCRLWLQPKVTRPKGLPELTVDLGSSQNTGEITLNRGMNSSLTIAIALHTSDGGLRILQDANQHELACHLPVKFVIGNDLSKDCLVNISRLDTYSDVTVAPYLYVDDDLNALPVSLRKPDGQFVQQGTWPSSKFRRYFIAHRAPSSVPNVTSTIYLRTLLIKIRLKRENYKTALRLFISIEAQYATRSLSQMVTTTLAIEHEMPSAGVLRGLEVWGGVLGALLSLYAVVQWRSVVRRGGIQTAIVPLIAGSVADALYFAALFSTLHALAAEAGTLGLTLPLSHSEEHMVKAFVYSAVALKALRLLYINLNQCKCDVFFLDWSEYNPPLKESGVKDKTMNWRAHALAREWSSMQTKRRACPGYTVTFALLVLKLLTPWKPYLPDSQCYKWALGASAWWSAYISVLLARWLVDKVLGSPADSLLPTCRGVGMSLLVFEEELYAHYVDGRNEDLETRTVAGSLATCRVVCAPQLRTVYKQLTTTALGAGAFQGDMKMKQALLSRFLAAFFERALDGISWVASERTLVEKLLDVETRSREGGGTSALLYDLNDSSPSCFTLTWWSQEWSLGTFDAMVFGTVIISGHDALLAAFVAVAVWQITKIGRQWFGNKNQKEKTGVDIK